MWGAIVGLLRRRVHGGFMDWTPKNSDGHRFLSVGGGRSLLHVVWSQVRGPGCLHRGLFCHRVGNANVYMMSVSVLWVNPNPALWRVWSGTGCLLRSLGVARFGVAEEIV